MSPNKRKNLLRRTLTAHLRLGCGCGCAAIRPDLPDVYHPKPKPKPKPDSSSASTSSSDGNTSANTFSPAQCCLDKPGPSWPNEEDHSKKTHWKIEESLAVVKETEDPYGEFRQSMMQMIFEMEISSPLDLHHLLRRFLRLNSPAHHDVILHAFFDVFNAVVSNASSSAPMPVSRS